MIRVHIKNVQVVASEKWKAALQVLAHVFVTKTSNGEGEDAARSISDHERRLFIASYVASAASSMTGFLVAAAAVSGKTLPFHVEHAQFSRFQAMSYDHEVEQHYA